MQTRIARAAFPRAVLVTFVLAAGALAADESSEDRSLEDLLLEKGVITAEERAGLGSGEPAASGGSEAPPDAADGVDEEPEEEPRVVTRADHKGIRVETTDGRFRFAFGGRLQVDAAGFIEPRFSNLGNGIEMRRARIKSEGWVFSDWHYKLEVNFDADLDVPVTDGLIAYHGFDPFVVVIGHQKVPFSQQSMNSSNWMVFQERSLGDTFIDNSESGRRRLGGVVGAYGDRWTHWNLYAGVFGQGLDDAGIRNEDWGVASRLVVMPIAEKGKLISLGGAVYYRRFKSLSDLAYGSRPESQVADTRMVDTGATSMPNATSELLWNVEASTVLGAFHAQGEYTWSRVERRPVLLPGTPVTAITTASNVVFSGWYVQAGYFLTGESRRYNTKNGKYQRILPHSKRWGAWEIALRYSGIDLQDRDIRGGFQQDVTAALNWWTNASVMFRFNYVYASTSPTTAQVVTINGFQVDEKAHVFQGRAQIVF